MHFYTLLLIALGLSADATAVALCSGSLIRHLKLNKALKIAYFFGGFQGLMTLLGWLIGTSIIDLIRAIDHWIAFGLLTLVGCKMIREALDHSNPDQSVDPLDTKTLTTLAIATSLDALAVGISFATLEINILQGSLLIGGITFGLALIAVFVGHRFGGMFGKKIEILGGLILIGIGIKILFEHLSAPG